VDNRTNDDKAPNDIVKIVKIQAIFRGWLDRRRVKKIKEEAYTPGIYARQEKEAQGSGFHDYNSASLEQNYDNPNVLEQRAELGDFVYDEFQYEADLGKREERGEEMLENAARYKGEWLVSTSTRQGRGM
jgi:hypothetical protein